MNAAKTAAISKPAPVPAAGAQKSRALPSAKRFFSNYLSTMLFIGITWFICTHLTNFHRNMLGALIDLHEYGVPFRLTVRALFNTIIATYAVVLVYFYLRYPWLHAKAFVFLRGAWMRLLRGKLLSPTSKQAFLVLLLKFFFAPLMINWCLAHVGDLIHNGIRVWWGIQADQPARVLFDTGLFWFCFQTILFVDTFLFTLGYLIETPALNNRIRTVEPTFLGWFVCLACYPPFNGWLTNQLFDWHSTDFPQFQNDTLHFVLNGFLLVLMGVYSWASVALGFKASNLTNRGIVSHGPYAYVRHPAYAAKNLAWWIGAMPTIGMLFMQVDWSFENNAPLRAALYAVLGTIGWSFMYTMRALTEERHLMIAHNGYQEYARKVRWRFIPGLV